MNLAGIVLVLFGLWIAIGLGYAESWSGVCCQWYPLTVAIGLVIAGAGGILLLPDLAGNQTNVNNNINNYYDQKVKYGRLKILRKFSKFKFYKIEFVVWCVEFGRKFAENLAETWPGF